MLSLEAHVRWNPAENDPPSFRSTVDSAISEAEAPRTPHPPGVLKAGTDLGRLLGGRYILLDWIGRGGMADVFLARDVASARMVAIKLLAKELRGSRPHRELMVREAALARAVDHQHVVRTIDAGSLDDGAPYLVLEPLTGETLHDYLHRHRTMPICEALPLLRQLAEGLVAIHSVGIVHGDIKPKNVFLCGPVDAPTEAQIIDFGLARAIDP